MLFMCALLICGASTIVADDTPIVLEVNRICEQNGEYIDFRGMSDGEENGYYYIDLGLSSGIKWATRNIGAATEEQEGSYFAWGELTPNGVYSWSHYKWCEGSDHTLIKYCFNPEYGKNGYTDTKSTLEWDDDVVSQTWGGAWRMPTASEVTELILECDWELWGNGFRVTGPNGHQIYMPMRVRDGVIIWSSSLSDDSPAEARGANWYFGGIITCLNNPVSRALGYHVRGVCK